MNHENQYLSPIAFLVAGILVLIYTPLLADAHAYPDSEWPLGNQPMLRDDTSDPIAKGKRVIRVLVSYSDTNYFVANGRQHGLEYEMMSAFEDFLNKGRVPVDKRRVVVFISVPFDCLIPELVRGKGDIAAAGLTITDERKNQVAFSKPYRKDIKEIVVKGSNTPTLTTVDDLSGKQVHVVSGSSYASHLSSINDRLSKNAKPPVKIIEVDPNLEAEDILQMVNAGIYRYTVVDNHIAALWSRVLNDMVPLESVSVNAGGLIAWAVRKENPRLLASLNHFVLKHKQGTLLGNMLFNRYYKDTRWVKNPLTKTSRTKLIRYMPLFKKYGEMYGIDWKLLAALAFQESGLNQKRESSAGAVGNMQIKPQTAAGRHIGIANVRERVENNIHAGTKYLHYLHGRYFSQPSIPPNTQLDFTLAAYNAGPARVQSLRKKAAQSGLDPNTWFFNVEHEAHKRIGRETVTYVGNVYKYYIAFSSAKRTLLERSKVDRQARRTP